jgi:hypothetical protein
MLFREIIVVYSEITGNTNTHCGHNSEFVTVKAGGIYSYHCALKD